MKFFRCKRCSDLQFLPGPHARGPAYCECGGSAGWYNSDGDTCRIWGQAELFGLDNRVFTFGRAEAFRYDISNGKVEKLPVPPRGEYYHTCEAHPGVTLYCPRCVARIGGSKTTPAKSAAAWRNAQKRRKVKMPISTDQEGGAVADALLFTATCVISVGALWLFFLF